MGLQLFLVVNIMSVSLMAILILLIYRPPGMRDWMAIHAGVLALGAAMLYAGSDWAGAILAAVFVPFVLVPSVLVSIAIRRAGSNRMRDAARLARWAAIFHPTARARFLAQSLLAQSKETLVEKAAALRDLQTRAPPHERALLEVVEARINGDWERLIALARAYPEFAGELKVLEIRSLGETGRLGPMIAAYEAARSRLLGNDLYTALLFVMAFNGRRDGVERLLDHRLRVLDNDAKLYWRAVAARNASPNDTWWREAMQDLATSAVNPTTRQAASRQLELTPDGAAQLTAHEREALATAEQWLLRQPVAAPIRSGRTPVTYLLIALNLAAFAALEVYGGSQHLRTVVSFGGMWPPLLIEAGEWWRLGSALFLHYGALHLGVNMLLLFLLGRDCEARVGSLRMLTAYLGGGLASSAGVLGVMWIGWSQPAVLVGASGAIFALIGYEVVRRLIGWTRYRDALDGRGLVIIAIVLVIQFVIDINIPQISLAAHAIGLAAGLLIGALLELSAQRKS